MAYMDNKAAGRRNPTDTVSFSSPGGTKSNQEQMTKPNVRVGSTPAMHNPGNQVKFASNTKGTGTLGNALNSYKKTLYPAVQNPDPQANTRASASIAGYGRNK